MFIDRFGVFADQGESMFLVLRAARENVHLEVITKRDGVIVPLGSESTAAGRRLVAIQATFPSSGWHEVGVWSTSRNSFGNYLLSMQEGQVQSPAIDAERWLFVSRQEGSGVTTHLDLQGIRKINESAGSVWLRHDYDSPTRNTFPASPIDKELGLEEFDCRERTLRHRQVAYYLEGRQVDSVVFQTEPWKAVVPNSNGERWLKLGCELLSALN
jgi:hypothetical protein